MPAICAVFSYSIVQRKLSPNIRRAVYLLLPSADALQHIRREVVVLYVLKPALHNFPQLVFFAAPRPLGKQGNHTLVVRRKLD